MEQEKENKLLELTSICYENLEKIEVLITLLQEKCMGEKPIDVTFDMILAIVKNTEETIVNIQNNALLKLS